MKTFTLTAVLAASTLALTACLDVAANVVVHSDARASGDMTVAISEDFSTLIGVESSQDLVDQIEQGSLDGAEAVSDLACSPLQRQGAVAMTCTFTNQTFDQPDDLWNIYAGDDGTVTFIATSGEAIAEEDADLLGDLDLDFGGYFIAVEMPGQITSIEGTNVEQTSETTFAVQSALDENFDVIVTSDSDPGGVSVALLLAITAVAVGATGLTALFIRRAQKRNDDEGNRPSRG